MIGLETPEEGTEGAEFLTQGPGQAGIAQHGFDLPPVANDPRVSQQAKDAALVPARDSLEVEIDEGLSEILALAQNRQPTETRLESFQAEFLEKTLVVIDGKAPFIVMIGLIVGGSAAPATTTERSGRSHLA